MAGIANDYLIYPILDLIRAEVRKSNTVGSTEIDPFAGEPSVLLFRDNAADPERVTGANIDYESGYAVQVFMTFGSEDATTYPINIGPDDPDWEYFTTWRLTNVTSVALNPSFEPLVTYSISLNYDGRGLLMGTTVDRI